MLAAAGFRSVIAKLRKGAGLGGLERVRFSGPGRTPRGKPGGES
jgi:hypothetical protein